MKVQLIKLTRQQRSSQNQPDSHYLISIVRPFHIYILFRKAIRSSSVHELKNGFVFLKIPSSSSLGYCVNSWPIPEWLVPWLSTICTQLFASIKQQTSIHFFFIFRRRAIVMVNVVRMIIKVVPMSRWFGRHISELSAAFGVKPNMLLKSKWCVTGALEVAEGAHFFVEIRAEDWNSCPKKHLPSTRLLGHHHHGCKDHNSSPKLNTPPREMLSSSVSAIVLNRPGTTTTVIIVPVELELPVGFMCPPYMDER